MPSQLPRLLVAALAVALCSGPSTASSASPVGSPISVSLADGLDHFAPDVAVNAQGVALVVWQAAGLTASGNDIYARRFGADGAPLGDPFRVNNRTVDQQRRAAVAALADDSFAVVWDTATSTVWARRFGADGAPRDPDDLPVSASAVAQFDADIAPLPGGGFVVAWQYAGPSDDGIFVRRFAADGSPAGDASTPYDPATDPGLQENPALATGAGGALAVVWEELNLLEGGEAIRLSRYDPAGAPVVQAAAVAATSTDNLRDPAVAVDGAGVASVAWATLPNGSPPLSRIELRRLDAAGAPLGGAATLSAAADAERSTPSVALGAWGAIVAWGDNTTAVGGTTVGVAARELAPAGAAVGAEQYPRLPTLGAGQVNIVAAAATADGAWVVWGEDFVAEGSDLGAIYARQVGEPSYRVALPLVLRP